MLFIILVLKLDGEKIQLCKWKESKHSLFMKFLERKRWNLKIASYKKYEREK